MNTPGRRKKIAASILLLSALGFLLFWLNWFLSGDYLDAGDELFRAFENTFPLPDGVLAVLLVATAALLLYGSPLAAPFGLVASGMLFYLASLDTWYNLIHGGFLDWRASDTWTKACTGIYCYGLATALWIAFRNTGKSRLLKAPRLTRSMTIMLLAFGIAAEILYVLLLLLRDERLIAHYLAAFALAEAIAVYLGALAASRIVQKQARILAAVLCFCGMELFHALIHAALLVQHPILGGQPGDVGTLSLSAFRVLFIITLALIAWRERETTE